MRCRVILCCLLLTSACAQPDRSTPGRPDVVASFYPIYEAARYIGGQRVSVTNLTAPGAEPHEIELTPKQVDRIIDANLVLYFGRGFQPAVEDAVKRSDGIRVDLLRTTKLHATDGDADEIDPHIWLDPHAWTGVIPRIAAALSNADPDGSSVYQKNGAAYAALVGELDDEFRDGLDGCERDEVVTSHAAFAYLAERYGLEQLSIAGVSPEAEPTPKRLGELSDIVKDKGVTTIFTETLLSPKIADALAREAGVKTAVLDPIEGLTREAADAAEDYFSVMRDNLAALRDALGCP
jgi:zinc transport system substrate-binding protein